MSFRSRTRTKPVVPVRRSASLTRTNPATASPSLSRAYGTSNYTNPSMYHQTPSSYLNLHPYHTNHHEPISYSPRNSGYFDYASGTSSGLTGSKRRDSYGSNSSVNTLMYSNPVHSSPAYAYKSPYKDRERYGNSSSSYTSPYSNRYVSPYSTYENGITTAGLSFHVAPGHSNLLQTSKSSLSGSNSSLNQYRNTASPSRVSRTTSLREQERKGRSKNRKQITSSPAPIPRSLSVSSAHSDVGYESGGEHSQRDTTSTHKDDSSENGEFIDYKALYEAAKAENDQLKQHLSKKDEELSTTKSALERFTNSSAKNTLSEIEKRERRAMERKISEMEEELKQMDALKADNQRLKDENGALIRVISKLSK